MRRTAIGALVICLLLAGVAAWLARAQKAHQWIGAQITAALGPSVRFADARLTFWPPLTLSLDDVAWLGDDGEPAATAASIRARISVRALLRGQLVLGTVAVDRPAATLARDAGGALRLGGRALAGDPTRPALDLDAVLPRLQIHDGTLLLIDRTVAPVRRIALSAISATLEPLRPGARLVLTARGVGAGALRIGAARLGAVQVQATLAACAPPLRGEMRLEVDDVEAASVLAWLPPELHGAALQGHIRVGADLRGTQTAGEVHAFAELDEGRLDWRDVQAVAPMKVRGTAAWSDARIYAASADVDLAGLHRAPVDARTVHGTVTWDGSLATLTGARATAFGGTWVQSGAVTLTAPPIIAGELRGEGVDGAALARGLGAVMPALRALRADGPLTVSARGRGTFEQTLRGHLELRQDGGGLGWSALRAAAPLTLAGDVSQQGGTWSIANGQARAAALAVDRGSLRDVEARFALVNDALRVDSLTATANGDAWRVSGTVPLRPGLPGSLRAAGRAAGLELPDIEASFVHTGASLQIPSFRARAFGAMWTGNATSISSSGIEAHVNVTGVNFQALLATLADGPGAPESPGGVATLSADLSLTGEQQRAVVLDLRLSSGRFVWNELTVEAPARLNGTLRSAAGLGIHDATASAAVARYGPLRGEGAQAAFHYAGSELSFSSLTFRAAGGTWKHSGSYQLDGTLPMSGNLAVSQVDPAAALTMLGRPTAVEGAKLDFDATWKGRAVEDWRQTLVGSGRLALRGGALRGTAILSALWDAITRRVRRQDSTSPRNALQSATADFTLGDAALHTANLRLNTTDYGLTGKGTLGLDGQIDLDTQVTLTSAGLQHMFSLGVVPLPTSMLPSFPPIPTHISGAADALIVRPDVGALPESTLRWAAGAAVQVPRALGGLVVRPFESLFDDARNALVGPSATPAQ